MENTAPFEIGDEVVCVWPIGSQYIKGHKYLVKDIQKGHGCGWEVFTGIIGPQSKRGSWRQLCGGCGKYLIDHDPRVFVRASRFRRVPPAYTDAISEILENFKPYDGVETDVVKVKETVNN